MLSATNYTVKQQNFQKGTTDYIGTTDQLATAIAAEEFGDPFDSYTAYDSSNKVVSINTSVGTAWITY